MDISRRSFMCGSASLAFGFLTGCFGLFDDERNKPLYITEPDKDALVDLVEAFGRDFLYKNGLRGLNELVDNSRARGESVVLKSIEDSPGQRCEIIRPLQFREVKSNSQAKASMIREDAHAIDAYYLEIRPDRKDGYYGSLSFSDPAGDLGSFLIAVDGKVYREGMFVERGAMDWLDAFQARTQMEIGGATVETDKMPILVSVDEKGKFFGYHVGSGMRYFGDIPVGRHELMFYAMDKRGNRSFAAVNYDIGPALAKGHIEI